MATGDSERGERLQIMLSENELTALDGWRFSRRMPSRAAAVRELLRLGLSADGVKLAVPGQKSSSFGMLSGGKAEGSSGLADGAE